MRITPLARPGARVAESRWAKFIRSVSRGRLFLMVVLLVSALTNVAVAGPTIVLIGGDKQGYPHGEHDYPDGILKIEQLINEAHRNSARFSRS